MTDLERQLMLVLEAILECEIGGDAESDGNDEDGWWYHVPPHLHERMTKALADAQDKEVA